MSVCKKCLSEEVCRYNDGINLYCKDDYDCPHFKNKADFVEVKDCELCIYNHKHATEYPCSHCKNCYTDKFKQIADGERK